MRLFFLLLNYSTQKLTYQIIQALPYLHLKNTGLFILPHPKLFKSLSTPPVLPP